MITVVCKCGVGLQQQGGIKCISLQVLAFGASEHKDPGRNSAETAAISMTASGVCGSL